MTERLVLDSDKILISKPGFSAADPSLAEENKVFDSSWAFSNLLLHSGYYAGAGSYGGGSSSIYVPFSDVGYIPMVYTRFYRNWHGSGNLSWGPSHHQLNSVGGGGTEGLSGSNIAKFPECFSDLADAQSGRAYLNHTKIETDGFTLYFNAYLGAYLGMPFDWWVFACAE